jgi:hypothetical protein
VLSQVREGRLRVPLRGSKRGARGEHGGREGGAEKKEFAGVDLNGD